MASGRFLQSNFAAGELSPRMFGSADLDRYAAGLEVAQNLLVLPLGAVERRSGSIWVEDPKAPALNGRLLPFVREIGDAVAVVVQNEVLRFIDVATRTYVLSGGLPVEIACPWVEADYPHLFSWQSVDVLWIGNRRGTRAVRVLKRIDGVWQALGVLDIQQGPFLPDMQGVDLTFAAVTGGNIDVSASANVFTASHVGTLLGVRENTGAPPLKRWVAAETVAAGEQRYNAGRVYEAVGSGVVGNNSPIHDDDIVSDGGGAVSWKFLHDGWGVARIISVSSPTAAKADIIARLPNVASSYWGFGAFSTASGHPRSGVVHSERQVLAGSNALPDNVFLSRVSAYGPDHADFKAGLGTGLIVDSDAVSRALSGESVQPILHLLSFERLYAFTTEGVHVLSGPSLDEPLTPAGASARARSGIGAQPNVAPVKAIDGILFVTLGGGELREILRDEVATPNASVLVDHIAGRGLAELAFARSPYPVCWTRLEDGGLATMTYEPLERVRAWAEQEIGGGAIVTSAIAMPGADGRSEVWVYVGRMIDGAMRYAIEVLPAPWSQYREPLERACCLDAAGYFDFWNDGATQARLTILNAETRAARIDTDVDAFVEDHVGLHIGMRLAEPKKGFDPGADALMARMEVQSVVNARRVEGRLDVAGAPSLPGVWTTRWGIMRYRLEVGARLEGMDVDVFGDGEAQMGLKVEDGDVILPKPVLRGWVGLRAPFKLIDLPLAQGSPIGTALAAQKKLERVWAVVPKGATLPGAEFFNPDTGEGDDLFRRDVDDAPGRPPVARGSYLQVLPKGAWSENGQIGIRQDAPFPFVLLGLIKEVS